MHKARNINRPVKIVYPLLKHPPSVLKQPRRVRDVSVDLAGREDEKV